MKKRSGLPRTGFVGASRIFMIFNGIKLLLVGVLCFILMCYGFILLYESTRFEFVRPGRDMLPTVQRLREEGRLMEVVRIGDAMRPFGDLWPNITETRKEIAAAQEELDSYLSKVARFLGGAISGDSKTPAALAGAAATDLLVIGDIRDLGKQGWNWWSNKEVDELIVVLSSAGIVASVSSVSGIGALGEGAINVTKSLRRAGALSATVSKNLVDATKLAINERKVGPLAEHMGVIWRTYQLAPAGTMAAVVRHADDMQDFKRIEKALEVAPNEVVALMAVDKADGMVAIRSLRSIDKISVQSVLRGPVFHYSKFTLVTRVSRMWMSGRLTQITKILASWAAISWSVFFVVLAGTAVTAVGALTGLISGVLRIWRAFMVVPTKPGS